MIKSVIYRPVIPEKTFNRGRGQLYAQNGAKDPDTVGETLRKLQKMKEHRSAENKKTSAERKKHDKRSQGIKALPKYCRLKRHQKYGGMCPLPDFVGNGNLMKRRSKNTRQPGAVLNSLVDGRTVGIVICCGDSVKAEKQDRKKTQNKNCQQCCKKYTQKKGKGFSLHHYVLGIKTDFPPIYGRRTSGIFMLPSACRLFSRNAISILGGATTVLFKV